MPRMFCACFPTPDSMRSLYTEAWDKAKQARVNQRAIRNVRKQRQAHERSFAQVCEGGEVWGGVLAQEGKAREVRRG